MTECDCVRGKHGTVVYTQVSADEHALVIRYTELSITVTNRFVKI